VIGKFTFPPPKTEKYLAFSPKSEGLSFGSLTYNNFVDNQKRSTVKPK